MAKQIRYDHFLHGGDYNPEQWLDRPDILKKDIEYFKKAHINTVSMGMFSWAVLEPEEGRYNFDWLEDVINNLYKEGIYTILSTPSGARPKWMADKYKEVLRVDPDRTRRFFGGRHNHCYTSPVYREKIYNINKKLSEHFGKHPAVILWHISNEYGGECHCPLCQEKFREWLKEKYGTIENLNSSWCTTFWSHTYNSFDQIESPSPKGENALHALTLDWKRFVTDRTVDFMRHEISAIRAGGSELPATANLMYDYDGLDYKKFKDVMDIVSWDNYPSWHKKDEYTTAVDGAMQHDLMRSIRKAPFLLMESCPSATNWKPINKLKKPGMHLAASLQAVAHGSDSVLYFQLRQSQGASEKFHGAVIDHYGGDDTRVFREVTEVGEALEQIREIVGSEIKCQAAVLYDRENDWALKDAQGPRNEDMHYQECVQKQYRALRRKGCNTDIITMEHDLSDYKLVTVPMAYMFYHGYAEKLCTFAENGGTLVISYWSGLVDETDKCYLEGTPHGLMEAAGIRTEEIDALYDWEENHGIPETGNHLGITKSYTCKNLCELAKVSDAEVMMRYSEDFYQGYPVLTHKKYGKGHVYYVAADMEAAFYEDFLGRAADEAGVDTPLDFVPEGVSVTTRETEDTEYLFIQNFAGKTEIVSVSEEYEVIYGTDSENMSPLQTRILKRKK
ncbi:MAG: beta-galactosidase [Clostridia bacterium]